MCKKKMKRNNLLDKSNISMFMNFYIAFKIYSDKTLDSESAKRCFSRLYISSFIICKLAFKFQEGKHLMVVILVYFRRSFEKHLTYDSVSPSK